MYHSLLCLTKVHTALATYQYSYCCKVVFRKIYWIVYTYLVAMPPRMLFVTRSVKTDLTNLHNLYPIIIANVEDT